MQNHEWLPFFIAAHGIGDFWLQNKWMSDSKAKSSFVCAVHVGCYLMPFTALAILGAPVWLIALIGAQHYAQDRYGLHLKWMAFYEQTPPDKWPVGPLCVDQAGHIGFMALVCLL